MSTRRSGRNKGARRRGPVPGAPYRPVRGGRRDTDARRESYVVPGERAVQELLAASPRRIREILVGSGRKFDWLDRAQRRGIEIRTLERDELQSFCPGVDPRGVVALADPPILHPLDALLERPSAYSPRVFVALDGVVDPQNLGAIVRSCEFFGVAGVFWARDRAVGLTPTVARASAGATERIAMAEVVNLAAALRTCRQAGFWIVGTVAEDGAKPLSQLVLSGGLPDQVVLVLGSEGRGIRRLTAALCDFKVTLPRRGALGSLNVSAAAAASLTWITLNAGQRGT